MASDLFRGRSDAVFGKIFIIYSEEIYGYFTVTFTFFVIPLLDTVITAVPFLMPFTTPLLLTVATFVLLLV